MDKTLKDAEAALSVSLTLFFFFLSFFSTQRIISHKMKITHERMNQRVKVCLCCAACLQGQIQELTEENNALIEKLTAEEKRRRELAEKCQVILSVGLI